MTETIRAIRIHAAGGPEAMVLDTLPLPEPGPGEVLVRHTAIGVNFIDIYVRSGAYPVPSYPIVLGMEGAGTVAAIGPGVAGLAEGDRVAYAAPPPGSYAEARVIAADRLVTLPDTISDRMAASMMLQGMTARYLLKETHPVRPGDTVLIHAAAGGMGLLLCQWAAALGATVIGTVSTREKAQLAARNGCQHPILYTEEDFVARVREITGGAGVQVVYDGVGRDTFLKSLDALAMRGHLVCYGAASGAPDPFSLGALSPKSATVTRPTLFHYIASRPALEANAADLFQTVTSGAVTIPPARDYALADAAEAHRDLEGRRTTGPIILIP